MKAGWLLKAVGLTAARTLCPALSSKGPARGTGFSSCWEGVCGEHGSVSPTNLHPTSLFLGTTHMFLICVCVLWHFFIFSPVLLLPLKKQLLHQPCTRCCWCPPGPWPSHSDLLPPLNSGPSPPSWACHVHAHTYMHTLAASLRAGASCRSDCRGAKMMPKFSWAHTALLPDVWVMPQAVGGETDELCWASCGFARSSHHPLLPFHFCSLSKPFKAPCVVSRMLHTELNGEISRGAVFLHTQGEEVVCVEPVGVFFLHPAV